MMKCFYYFKDKSKRNKSQSNPTTFPAPTSVISNSGNETEASSGSTSTKQMTKSAVSLSSARSISDIYEERGGNLRVFDLKELRDATNDFSRLLKIGEGGFGSVYKGRVRAVDGKGERTVVAIKMLNQNGLQGHKQWLAEVQFLAVVDHLNLVKLIGYCAVDGERGIQRLLVYEYMPNMSLEDHLFNQAHPLLPWDKRLEIALGTGQGLDYLHEGLEMPVIYRDFKASNVLLDKELKPKLSDFGLAREGPSGDRTHVTTAVVGTRGYAAPEYIETGHLTIKSDVWSFGVVLFEILTGRRSLERNRPKGEQKLLEWVKQFPVEGKKFHMIIDPRLGNHYSLAAARITAKLANRCLLKNAKERPTMHEVIKDLKEALHVTRTGESTDKREDSSSESESEKKPDEGQIGVAESLKRRMVHLARMGDTNNVVNRRRFMAMQRPNQAQEAQ